MEAPRVRGPGLGGPFNKVSLLLSIQETSMCPGECKDRMGDAFDRFGRVPIVRRTRVASSDDPAFRGRSRAPFWAAGGLVHDTRGAIVLVRVGRESGGSKIGRASCRERVEQ